MTEAFELVKIHAGNQHQQQKELYDKKIPGEPHKKGDLVWLQTPPTSRISSRKLYHPWSGPFKVIKQISESTYRIQQLNGRKQRKVVHFDRLKPCPPNIRLEMSQQTTSTSPNDEQEPSTKTNTGLVLIGTNLELIDDDNHGQENSTAAHYPEPQTRTHNHRYRQRDRRPPQRYDDFVSH